MTYFGFDELLADQQPVDVMAKMKDHAKDGKDGKEGKEDMLSMPFIKMFEETVRH